MDKIISLVFIALMLLPIVSAFEVTFPYFKDNKINMNPGQTRNFDIILQNMAGMSDETVRVFVSEGAEIAHLSGQEYIVKQGTARTHSTLTIAIPKDAAGKIYNVNVVFMTDTNVLEQKFIVEVSGGKSQNDYLLILAAAALIALIILIIILLRKRR